MGVGEMVEMNSMEGGLVPPLALTREAVMALNNYSVTFEHARSLFGVDLPTFKAKLVELNIFVWNEPNGLRVRIHGGPYEISIFIKNINKLFVMEGTLGFSDVIFMIEKPLGLHGKGYELTYEHPEKVYNPLKTDRDWHYAVEYSKVRGYLVHLNLDSDDPFIVALMATYDEDVTSDDEDAS